MSRKNRIAQHEVGEHDSPADENGNVAVADNPQVVEKKKRQRDPSIIYIVAEIGEDGKASKVLLTRATVGQAKKSLDTVREITKLGSDKVGIFRIKRVV